MAVNKKAQNFRTARKAGYKPGTAIRDASGAVTGGTKLPTRQPPRLPPLPSKPDPRPRGPSGGGGIDIGVGSESPPYANLPNAPRPRGPGVYGTPPAGGSPDAPVSGPGGPVFNKPLKLPMGTPPMTNPGGPGFNPMSGSGMEAGKADMIGGMAYAGGTPGFYEGTPPSGGIYAGGGGGSQGFDGAGQTRPGFDPSLAPILPGGNQSMDDQAMQQFLGGINLPKRFQGNVQAAAEFMRSRPQSRLGQQFAQQQGGGMNYNPLMGFM